jgi:TRAP-type C4-dicarboxylate transport system permease small subunit
VPPDRRTAGLDRAQRALHRIEDGLLALLLGGLILIATAQIALRNLFDSGVAWGDPLLRGMVLWLGLLGALAASRGNRQITVDVLSRTLPPRAREGVRALTCSFTALVAGLVSWHGTTLVRVDLEAGSLAFGAIPAWCVELIIPVSFGLIALRYALLGLAHARSLLTGAEP